MDAQGYLVLSNITPRFFSPKSERYVQRIYGKRLVLDNIVEFIDGTVLRKAQPEGRDSNQRSVYNGHKRKHALKFQEITTPDGLCAHFFGAGVGRRHDMFLYAESNEGSFLADIPKVGEQQ